MELAQALGLAIGGGSGTRQWDPRSLQEPKTQGVVPPHPPPPNTHQLQGLAGAVAQRSLWDTQRVPEQHQLLRVAQLVDSAL